MSYRGILRAAERSRINIQPQRRFSVVADLFNPTPEHAELRKLVRDFTAREVEPQAAQYNRDERFNRTLFNRVGELGLLGVSAPPECGGAGLDATAVAIVHEELSASDPAFCLSYLAHSLLFVNNLAVNGSPAQRERLLPRACSGELLCGMAMSEVGAGTDVLGMTTRAVREANGDYTLNGSKMWITNGAADDTQLGDAFLLYARDAPPKDTKREFRGAECGKSARHHPGSFLLMQPPTSSPHRPSRAATYSLFLVEKGAQGFSLGHRIKDKCGMRASNTAELVLESVRVPASSVVGKPGSAVLSMMRNLEIERVGLAAMSLGIARRCIETMNTYAKERVAFGSPLNRHGQIQRHIAASYAEFSAARAYVYNTARQMNLAKEGGRLDSDGVKLFAAPMATGVANRAIQVLGGSGYVGGNVVERLWRDAKLLEIGGGTNESHERNITKDLAKLQDMMPW